MYSLFTDESLMILNLKNWIEELKKTPNQHIQNIIHTWASDVMNIQEEPNYNQVDKTHIEKCKLETILS